MLFKRVVGDANLGQVSIFMTSLGLLDLCINCIPTTIIVFTGSELIDWAYVPWLILGASAILNLSTSFSIPQ